ncbi:MAG TPA: hypothetical protein VFV38_44180 [Ktedonobacteraceae bacterium]|nr:hypothetical protein [Ktedonobacteraceae bacterium]
MTQSGSYVEAYAVAETTEKVTVVPRTIAQSEQIARYFIEDLEHFIAETHIDLMYELGVPSEEAQDSEEVMRKLFDDLSQLLRNSMITGIHLLLSEPTADPNSSQYKLRYHAEYTINTPARDIRPDREQYTSQRINGYLQPGRGIWLGAKFALLIDWNPSMNERRRNARQPEYWFNWLPRQERFDPTTLVRYREGGMAFDGANVVHRSESTAPGYDARG